MINLDVGVRFEVSEDVAVRVDFTFEAGITYRVVMVQSGLGHGTGYTICYTKDGQDCEAVVYESQLVWSDFYLLWYVVPQVGERGTVETYTVEQILKAGKFVGISEGKLVELIGELE